MGDKLQGGKIAGDVLNRGAKDGKRKLWSTAARCVQIAVSQEFFYSM